MTFLTNSWTISFEKVDFQLNWPENAPRVPPRGDSKSKNVLNDQGGYYNMHNVSKQCLNDISDEFQSNNIRKTWILG